MRTRRPRFEVDRENGKMLGVCAGLANSTGIDATLIRVGTVLVALFTSFTAVLVIYLVAGFVGHRRRGPALATSRSAPRDELRDRTRSLDLRLQAIETHVTSSNSQLAREIEDLR